MTIFPVTIKKGKPIYTSEYYVKFGGTDVANCDTLDRANMIKRALEVWQTTPDYKAWHSKHIKPCKPIKENTIKFNVRVS